MSIEGYFYAHEELYNFYNSLHYISWKFVKQEVENTVIRGCVKFTYYQKLFMLNFLKSMFSASFLVLVSNQFFHPQGHI